MAHVTLTPVTIPSDGRISVRGEPVKYEWEELVAKFIVPDPERAYGELRILAGLRRGMVLGKYRAPAVVRTQEKIRLFSVRVTRGRTLDFVLKELPDFPERVVEAYRVEDVDLDRRLEEGHHDAARE